MKLLLIKKLGLCWRKHIKFIKCPVFPKEKETHFKIIQNHQVAEFLERIFKFEEDHCSYYKEEDGFFVPVFCASFYVT